MQHRRYRETANRTRGFQQKSIDGVKILERHCLIITDLHSFENQHSNECPRKCNSEG